MSPNTAKNSPKTATNKTLRENLANILSDATDSSHAAIIGAMKIQSNSKTTCPMNVLGVLPEEMIMKSGSVPRSEYRALFSSEDYGQYIDPGLRNFLFERCVDILVVWDCFREITTQR